MIYKVKCNNCGKVYPIAMTEEQHRKIVNSEDHIQNIIPDIKPEIRELFISGVCPDCWKEIFKEEE